MTLKKNNQANLKIKGRTKQKNVKKLVLTIFIILFFSIVIFISGAGVLNTLFSGESSKVLTFTEAGNQTDYFNLPENANVTSSAFNLQGLAYGVASLFQTLIQSDFDEGTYNQTEYNTTNNAVQLNLSYNAGNYTSNVLDTGWNSSYQNLTWHEQRIECPEGMAYINKLNGFCIDKYEAVAMNADGTWNESSDDNEWVGDDTILLLDAGGYAGSEAGHYPWVQIRQTEARTACSNAGKHLCTDEEWLATANIKGQVFNLPASITDCTVSSNCVEGNNLGPDGGDACYGGSMIDCVSAEGVYDMFGNVWEWTNETVNVTNPDGPDGIAGWRYINTTDMTWGPKDDSTVDDGTYGNDGVYFPTTTTGRAVLRGGHWGNGAEAGPFCAALSDAPSPPRYNVGFRCCSS